MLCSKIYSISNIFLFELFLVICDTSICKIYVFKFVLSLVLFNFLPDFLKVDEKSKTTIIFYKKIFKKKKIKFCPHIWGLSSLDPRPRAALSPSSVSSKSVPCEFGWPLALFNFCTTFAPDLNILCWPVWHDSIRELTEWAHWQIKMVHAERPIVRFQRTRNPDTF